MKTHIHIRSIGKPQETWMQDAAAMYLTRCRTMGKFEMLELSEGNQGSAKPDIARTKQTEAEELLKNLPKNNYVIALDENGQQLTSPALAGLLEKEASLGKTLTFQIGGSWGLDESLIQKADLVLSLGKMTFPHAIAKILLLEQLYRAHTIIAGKEYHK
ncbi:MAG TPA: 23S rRNA (pseudouridine(1915)-N(3))-methyltransferase RlmH [bacterium]|nr:MAG: Ribosomal RNA large subunit methyltransferase H [Parcubacteria group bacterium ADurb.Bin192]HPN14627.1 23S rRNA (pseudouridine(1915)-N(3))-methyltransferase RlmH [bacterium]